MFIESPHGSVWASLKKITRFYGAEGKCLKNPLSFIKISQILSGMPLDSYF